MTLHEYKTKYESDLEEMWNDSAKYQFLNKDSFAFSMWSNRKAIQEEDEA